MTLSLWTIDIDATQLANCLQSAIGEVAGSVAIIEIEWWNRPVEMTDFADGLAKLTQSPGDSLRGSAFGRQIEIRWRKVSDNLRLVIASEISLPGLTAARSGFAWKSIVPEKIGWDGEPGKERSLLLWGSDVNSENTWSELRIGHPLAYPVTPDARGEISAVELKIVEYFSPCGQVILARRAGMQARQGKSTSQKKDEVSHA